MDGIVKLMDDHRSSSDNESGYNSRGAALVSSTVSEDLIGLNIQNEVDAVSTISFDEDILSVCANDEDTKFVDDILIGERQIETRTGNGKRRRDSTEFIEPNCIPKPKRNRTIDRHFQHSQPPQKRNSSEMLGNLRCTKSMPLPNEKVVQLSEISSSTRSDVGEMKKSKVPCKMSDLFDSSEGKKIAEMFGNPCLKFLQGNCEDEKCIHGHELTDSKNLREHLNQLAVEEVRIALNSHVRAFGRLLERYFCTFTEYFGENGHKADLIEMMSICKNANGCMQSNCVHVMDGLVQVGMTYSNALSLVLNCHSEFTEKSMFVLTTLITDKRNDNVTRFQTVLKSFYEKKFRFNAIIMDRMMQICLDLPYDESWFSFVRKMVNEWAITSNIGDLNMDLVYDFCSMTPRRSNIIRKYRSNLN